MAQLKEKCGIQENSQAKTKKKSTENLEGSHEKSVPKWKKQDPHEKKIVENLKKNALKKNIGSPHEKNEWP